jgi:hypothetical protein
MIHGCLISQISAIHPGLPGILRFESALVYPRSSSIFCVNEYTRTFNWWYWEPTVSLILSILISYWHQYNLRNRTITCNFHEIHSDIWVSGPGSWTSGQSYKWSIFSRIFRTHKNISFIFEWFSAKRETLYLVKKICPRVKCKVENWPDISWMAIIISKPLETSHLAQFLQRCNMSQYHLIHVAERAE